MDVFDILARDERQVLDARLFSQYKCPTDPSHDIAQQAQNPDGCFTCRAISVLRVLIDQNDSGNDLTEVARDLLFDVEV